ncbi:MAG: BMC domain-containing protein [Pseudomonadota bacterium]
MEYRAVGLVELNSVAKGVQAADEMLKAANVELILARPVCPGRYLAMVVGDTGAVKSAVHAGREVAPELLVDSFVIPNIHPAVMPALGCVSTVTQIKAVGLIETYSTASCILAADAAVKAADVVLLEIRFATGLAGKSFASLTGNVGAVQAAVKAGVSVLESSGLVLAHVVIPSPHKDLHQKLL